MSQSQVIALQQQDTAIQQHPLFNSTCSIEEANDEVGTDVTNAVQTYPSQQKIMVGGFMFTRHQASKSTVMYKCVKYNDLRCPMRIRYHNASERYYVHHHEGIPTGHNHPENPIDNFDGLTQKRREELIAYLLNTKETNAKTIADELNKGINTSNKAEFLTSKVVEEAKKKFKYSKRLTGYQELIYRSEFSKTLDNHDFIRCVHISALDSLVYFQSPWQLNRLNTPRKIYELYFDGTFDVAPQGIQQVVTLLMKDYGHNRAEPVVFGWLWNKTTESYIHFFERVVKHCPNILAADLIFLHCDFEDAMHNAAAAVFKGKGQLQIVACYFHLKKAIFSWIQKHNTPIKSNEQWKEEVMQSVTRFALERISNWRELRDQFIHLWNSRDPQFAKYLTDTYFGDVCRYPATKWAKTFFPRDYKVNDQTNNEAEVYHHGINRLFKDRPTMKKGVVLMQRIEKNCRDNKVHELQNIEIPANINTDDEPEIIETLPQIEPTSNSQTMAAHDNTLQQNKAPARKRMRPNITGVNPLEQARKKQNRRKKKSTEQYHAFTSSFQLQPTLQPQPAPQPTALQQIQHTPVPALPMPNIVPMLQHQEFVTLPPLQQMQNSVPGQYYVNSSFSPPRQPQYQWHY